MMLRWFLSGTVRQCSDLCHRVKKILRSQWDILTPQAREAILRALQELRASIASNADKKTLTEQAEQLEQVANKWLKPYPNASLRENVDVVLVALVVALGIRTFFLQPMAIPTGSMQPTLFGIMPNTPAYDADLTVPSLPVRVFHRIAFGIRYYHYTAKESGRFHLIDRQPQAVFPFVKRQRFTVGRVPYTIWFPVEGLFPQRVEIREGQPLEKGQDIMRLTVKSGDRLFVDRMTYNFRHPRRGEIIIFKTHGIRDLEQDTHYIKRLVGLGGERIRIGNDRHVIANGERLDASTPHFENVYTFDPEKPPVQNEYSGHVNQFVYEKFYGEPGVRLYPLAPKFNDGIDEFTVGEKHYLVFGDNTMNSKDSRAWGDFPQEKVIGKCFFVFWPISSRFGWGVR